MIFGFKLFRNPPFFSGCYSLTVVESILQQWKCGKKLTAESNQIHRCDIIVGTFCNVRQGTLQKFLKISIKNSKCAVSNKHIQDGWPGRYENRRGSQIRAKQHPEDPNPDPGTWKSAISSPRRRENQELCHLTAKGQMGFGRKAPNETIVPRRWGMMPEARLTTDPKL